MRSEGRYAAKQSSRNERVCALRGTIGAFGEALNYPSSSFPPELGGSTLLAAEISLRRFNPLMSLRVQPRLQGWRIRRMSYAEVCTIKCNRRPETVMSRYQLIVVRAKLTRQIQANKQKHTSKRRSFVNKPGGSVTETDRKRQVKL